MIREQRAGSTVNQYYPYSFDGCGPAGHVGTPGTPMALAPLIYTLWNRVMRFDPHACRSRRVERRRIGARTSTALCLPLAAAGLPPIHGLKFTRK